MAFMSGVTGQFYRQFAVTIAISTVISAINSLTLSPALAAKLLRPHDAPKDALTRGADRAFGWLFQPFNRFFDRSSDRYHGFVGRTLKRRGVVFAVYAALLAATALLLNAVPGGFIPVQDKLYLFAGAKLPEGASLARTSEVTEQMTKIALGTDGVEMMPAFAGLNALQGVNTPNITNSYVILKPFDQRHRSAAQINADLNARFAAIGGGITYALMPPPIQASATARAIRCTWRIAAGRLRGLAERAHRVPGRGREDAGDELPGQLVPGEHPAARGEGRPVEGEGAGRRVDRPVQHAAGLSRLDVRERLQPVRPRVPRDGAGGCRAPADGRRHREPAHAQREGRDGADRLDGDGGARVWPDPVVRYNGYPAANLIGDADPKVMSSSQAIEKLQQIAKDVLPPGITLEWTDLSYQQVTQSNAAIVVFPLAVMLVFLVLASLYESWTLPLAVILIVPVCICAALFGVWLSGATTTCSCRSVSSC